MSESHSTPAPASGKPAKPSKPGKPGKPAKPYPDFPLTAHPAGYWCKKIRGKIHYFGPWADPDAALAPKLSAPATVRHGSTLTYTIKVFNAGPSDAWQAALTALLVFGVGCLGAGVGQLLQQIVATRRSVRRLRRRVLTSVPESIGSLLHDLGLAGRVEVARDRDVYAFSFGLWRPRVILSTGMLDLLDPGELKAVLLHEAYHVRTLDALKVAVARAMARALFFLPLAQDLAQGYLVLKELAADEHAIRHMRDRWPLASALWKLARRAQHPAAAVTVAVTGEDTATSRIQHLLDPRCAASVPMVRSPARGLASAAAVALLVGLSAALLSDAAASPRLPACPMPVKGALKTTPGNRQA